MIKNLKNFITKLQNSDESVRKRWLIILSGLTMAAVVGLWVGYLNIIVDAVDAGEAGSKTQVKAETPEPGFRAAFIAGLKIVTGEVAGNASHAINFLREKLGQTNSIEIQGVERNFILEGLEKIPKTSLP